MLPSRFLPRFLAATIIAFLAIGATRHGIAEEQLPLVKDGEASSVVVIPRDAPIPLRERAENFIHIIHRSTGATLPLLQDDQPLPSEKTVLLLGDCAQTLEAGLRVADLPEETYRIEPRGRSVHILGATSGFTIRPSSRTDPWYASDPLRWALNYILETEAGVRWLWPGELGTYVPRQASLSLAARAVSYQPTLKMRTLVVATMRHPGDATIRAEALEWVANHQGGERGNLPLSHGFNDWWKKYHVDHPDYFAVPPPGQPQRQPKNVKLNLGNPAVLDQIVAEYLEAGRPKYWNVTPNDGVGFDTSETARSWDLPPNQPAMDIWSGQTDLTARYVEWWNRIYERLRVENPEVSLVTMAYSAYRMPPPPERPLKAKAVIGVVPSYRAFHVWAGWARHADELILRPNWGHYGANGPHLAMYEIAAYMRYAAAHKMIGFYLDSLLGFWGTQGANYYVMARLMADPERSVDSILDEYTAAFGKGASKIREYLAYWETITTEWAHGHKIHKQPEGRYDALIREKKISDNPALGPREALPFIYTDATLAPAFALLDQAQAAIGSTDAEATARVQFLRDGLNELKLTRDCIILGKRAEQSREPAVVKELAERAAALDALREQLSPSHAVWGRTATRMEDRYRFKIRPANLSFATTLKDEDF